VGKGLLETGTFNIGEAQDKGVIPEAACGWEGSPGGIAGDPAAGQALWPAPARSW